MNDIFLPEKSSLSLSKIPEELMQALWRLSDNHRRVESLRAEKIGLSPAEVRCLFCFKNHRYLTVKGLANHLGLVKSRISRILDCLEEKHLLRRCADPQDGRVSLICLSEEGEKKLTELEQCCRQYFLELQRDMSLERRSLMVGVLIEISQRIELTFPGNFNN